MWYIARFNDVAGFTLIESESLEKRVYSSSELHEFLMQGNKLLNVNGTGGYTEKQAKPVEAYSDMFYRYLSNVRTIGMIDDFWQDEYRFVIKPKISKLCIYNTRGARRERSQLFRIERPDLCILPCSIMGVSVYAQGYEYLLNMGFMAITGVYFNGEHYVIHLSYDFGNELEYILQPENKSEYLLCLGKVSYKMFKRKVLLCSI